IKRTAIRIMVILFLFVQMYPVLWMLMAAFKSPGDMTSLPAYALPTELYFKNFSTAWTTGRMSIFFRNSLIVTISSLFFIVFFSSTTSFALIKMKWKGQQLIASLFLMGIMVPVTIVLLPLFQIYMKLGLLNTYWSLIITYTGFGLSLSIFLISNYMRSMPDDIIEAAFIDGCNLYSLFFRIIVPLIKNALVTVVIIQFFFRWNDLIFSMTFISRTSMKTIQTGLMYFSDEYGSKNWGAIFAAISMGVTPTLLLYIVLNKFVIEGMTSGAVKG
ncbi:MAG: carbohydrate ABC transporter permease, partial [Spirochaetales bacterium]|nr:carbohydrate ABC transporter permease [Spirochaetales bacterium]